MDYTSNQAQLGVTQFPYVVMLGGCDVQYGKFHADLALYSVTHDTYCQLYHTNPFLDDLVPSVGTLLDGSQHAFESAGDSLKINNDIYEWSDQNFSGMAVSFFLGLFFFRYSMQTNNDANH